MTPPKEMKRQEAIYELIYTEEDYVRDLMLLDEVFDLFIYFLSPLFLIAYSCLHNHLVLRNVSNPSDAHLSAQKYSATTFRSFNSTKTCTVNYETTNSRAKT